MNQYPGDGGDILVQAFCKSLATVSAEVTGYPSDDADATADKKGRNGPLSNLNYGRTSNFDVLIMYIRRGKDGARPLTKLWLGPVRIARARFPCPSVVCGWAVKLTAFLPSPVPFCSSRHA